MRLVTTFFNEKNLIFGMVVEGKSFPFASLEEIEKKIPPWLSIDNSRQPKTRAHFAGLLIEIPVLKPGEMECEECGDKFQITQDHNDGICEDCDNALYGSDDGEGIW